MGALFCLVELDPEPGPEQGAGSGPASNLGGPTGRHRLDSQLVADRLTLVRERIAAAGAAPGTVTVVAVTKGFGSEAVSQPPAPA